ncbi:MAG: lactonase family protein [Chloroflexota bacterium]
MSTEILTIIGTYTKSMPFVEAKSEGIYVYKLNLETGELTYQSKATGIDNPAFLAISPSQKYLYSVNEVMERDGKKVGGVSAFQLDTEAGELSFLNTESSEGPGPCHLMVDATEKYVLAANYGGGSVCVLPIQPDGSVGPATDFIQHQGSSVNPNRQEAAHAHSINVDASNRYAYVPDLGMDKVVIYDLNVEAGKLTPNAQAFIEAAPGVGPRHFDFHPNGRFAYVINELGNSVTGYVFDESTGSLTEISTAPTLPDDFDGNNTTADIHVHPSGKFLYGSNRGHDSIAIFTVDETTGELTPAGHEWTQGKTPRNFGIDPTGKLLLAANQDTGSIATYFIDQESGGLTPTGHVADVPTPVCIKMIQ